MNWIDKLERRYGNLGIEPHQRAADRTAGGRHHHAVLQPRFRQSADAEPHLCAARTDLAPYHVLFQPIWLGGVFGVLNLLFYYWLGNALARVWGDFRTTLFLALGMLGAWVSCFLTRLRRAERHLPEHAVRLHLAVAGSDGAAVWHHSVQDEIPGLDRAGVLGLQLLTGSFAIKVSLVLGLAGFLAFYGREVFGWCVDAVKDWKRRRDWENRNR